MSSRRTYRRTGTGARFHCFQVTVKETDLWIAVPQYCFHDGLVQLVSELVWQERRQIEAFLERHLDFGATLEPYLLPGPAPGSVLAMVRAGNLAGVGPMAAVAGVLSEIVGRRLLEDLPEVIVENGGDLFIKIVEPVSVGIFAGNSPLSGKIALAVEPGQTPLGICTSSGTVGPSFSRGSADAAVVIAPSAALADAAATALGNLVHDDSDLEAALQFAVNLEGVAGALVIRGDKLALWGSVKLCPAAPAQLNKPRIGEIHTENSPL